MWPFNSQQQQQQQQQQQPNNQKSEPKNDSNNESPKGLDKFAHLLQNQQQDGDKANTPQQPFDAQALFKNKEFIGNLRSNIRQSIPSSISPETKAKIEANDPDAMVSMMSDIAESMYLKALEHSTSLQNLALDDKLKGFSDQTSNLVDNKLSKSQLESAIPQLKNPIARLGIEAFIEKAREQNPTASPEDINSQVKEYLSELGKDFGLSGSDDKEPEGNDVNKGIDWFEELGIQQPTKNS